MNILPFGVCTVLGGAPCVPSTPGPWTNTTDVALGNSPALSQASMLPCTVGGMIFVVDPGQHQIDVDKWKEKFAANVKKLDAALMRALKKDGEGKELTPLEEKLENRLLTGSWAGSASALEGLYGMAAELAKEGKAPTAALRALKGAKVGGAVLGAAPDIVAGFQDALHGDTKGAEEHAAVAVAGIGIAEGCTAVVTTGVAVPTDGVGILAEPAIGVGCGVVSSQVAEPLVHTAEEHPTATKVILAANPVTAPAVEAYEAVTHVDDAVDAAGDAAGWIKDQL
jgi:hypothetical protein